MTVDEPQQHVADESETVSVNVDADEAVPSVSPIDNDDIASSSPATDDEAQSAVSTTEQPQPLEVVAVQLC